MPSDSSAFAATPSPFVDEAEQDVLRPDVGVAELPGLFLGEHDDPAGPIGESLEHGRPFESGYVGAVYPRGVTAPRPAAVGCPVVDGAHLVADRRPETVRERTHESPSLSPVAPASPLLALPSMQANLDRVEKALREAVRTDDEYLTELARHLIVAGGKRLRPVVAMAAAMTTDAEISDAVVQGAVSVELVHLGSLYHDDVMDEADTRRGVETVNAKWGNLQAILAGDFLLSRASEIAASLGTEIAALLAQTIGRFCYGQIGELRRTYSADRTEAEYLDSIGGKTASLFATAARIGALVSGADRALVEALTTFGHAFGMVFQIVDDVLDLTATEAQLGKPAGHDLVEGVYTLPVIRTIAAGGPAAGELQDLLGRPLGPAECDKALAIVRSNGGVAETLAVGAEYVARAQDAGQVLPGGAGHGRPAPRARRPAGHRPGLNPAWPSCACPSRRSSSTATVCWSTPSTRSTGPGGSSPTSSTCPSTPCFPRSTASGRSTPWLDGCHRIGSMGPRGGSRNSRSHW